MRARAGQHDRHLTTLKPSGDQWRCARVRAHPSMQRARGEQEGLRNLLNLLRRQLKQGGSRWQAEGWRVQRTARAVVEGMRRCRRAFATVLVNGYPLRALGRADLDPVRSRARHQRVTQRRRQRRHQDRQSGDPSGESTVDSICVHVGTIVVGRPTSSLHRCPWCALFINRWRSTPAQQTEEPGANLNARPQARRSRRSPCNGRPC